MNSINTNIGRIYTKRTRKQSRTREAIIAIADIFEQEAIAERSKGKQAEFLWVDSAAFISITEEYSQPTIARARKALGVRCRHWQKLHEKTGRILPVGPWKWSQPMRTVDRAIEELHDEPLSELIKESIVNPMIERQRQHRIENTRSIIQLRKIMKDNKYDVSAFTVLHIYRDLTGFSRRTAFRVKKLLEIKSLTAADGEWRWVWPCDEVTDWLMRQLEDGNTHLVADIIETAKKEKDWSGTLIRAARQELGSIRSIVKERKIYWYDFNSQ